MTAVLVTYASKHHATEEIARAVGQQLEARGLNVEIHDVEDVKSLEPYSAVVMGSAVYAGRWMGEAQEFLKAFVDDLAARPVWLFASGPTGEGDPLELVKGETHPDSLQDYITQIQPEEITVFHGKLDMDELGFGERLIVRMVKAPTGDFRDWDMIKTWADKIASTLTTRKVTE